MPDESYGRSIRIFNLYRALVYFSEFVEKSKGIKINFEIHSTDDGLELLLGEEFNDEIENISIYLQEYTGFIKENVDHLTIYGESHISPFQADLLMLELKNQIRHLMSSVENKELEIKYLRDNFTYLKDNVEFLQYQIRQFHASFQAPFKNPTSLTLYFNQNQTLERIDQMTQEKVINIGNGNTIIAPLVVADQIENSFNTVAESDIKGELKELLNKLIIEVNEASKSIPKEAAESMARDVESLSKEVVSSKPRRKWYEISIEGLKEAAQAVGDVGKPILESVAKLSPMLNKIWAN